GDLSMNERRWWTTKLQRVLHAPSLGRVAKKVQDPYQKGMPDIICVQRGKVTWLELKRFDRWPVRGGPLAWANDERATFQRSWLREWVEKGHGHGGWILSVKDEWLLLPYDAPPTGTREELIEACIAYGEQVILLVNALE